MKFEDILREHHVAIAPGGHRHGSAGWVNFDCPRCGRGTNKYHMGYNIAHGYVNCRRCGRMSTVDVVMAVSGMAAGQAARLLRDVPRVRFVAPERTAGRLILPVGRQALYNDDAHGAYLTKRGFSPQQISILWGVEKIGLAMRLSWRLFIPIYRHGEMVSWTTRSIGDGPNVRRYIGAAPHEESYPAKELLYGAEYAQHAAIICEGPTDVWAIGPGAVATLGTSYLPAQVFAMSRFLVRAICFDSDPEAQVRARGLMASLAVFPGSTFNVVLSGKDAATAPRAEIAALRREFLGDE